MGLCTKYIIYVKKVGPKYLTAKLFSLFLSSFLIPNCVFPWGREIHLEGSRGHQCATNEYRLDGSVLLECWIPGADKRLGAN